MLYIIFLLLRQSFYQYVRTEKVRLIPYIPDTYQILLGMLGTAISNHYVYFTAVRQRWQLVQAQIQEREYRLDLQRHQRSQFQSDLGNLILWLDEAEAVQATQTAVPTGVAQLEVAARRHKVPDRYRPLLDISLIFPR